MGWSHRKKCTQPYTHFLTFLFSVGEGAPEPNLAALVCTTPSTPHTAHPEDARSNTALSKTAPAATQGTRPPGLTPQTIPHGAMRTCQRRRRVMLRGETPAPTLAPPKLGAAHSRDAHAPQTIYIFLHSQLPTWTLQTPPTVLGAIALRGHEPVDTHYQRTSASPYLREPWRGINHRS